MKTVLPRSLRATVWKAGNLICAFWIFGLAAALAAPADASAADKSRRPNIVIILGDDMGFSDMGSAHETENIVRYGPDCQPRGSDVALDASDMVRSPSPGAFFGRRSDVKLANTQPDTPAPS